MRSIYRLFFLLFLFTASTSFSQEVKLKISATHYENEIVYLWIEDDYFTRNKTLIDQSIIEDGEAFFNLDLDKITRVRIGINYQYGSLFLETDRDYEVIFPERDQKENRRLAWNTKVDLLYIDFPEEDINLQISTFNTTLDEAIVTILAINPIVDTTGTEKVVSKRNRKFSQRQSLEKYLDYMSTWDSIYSLYDSPFFKNYRSYAGASVAYSLGQHRDELYTSFLKSKPVLYNNPEYANFFNEYFNNYLDTYNFYPFSERRDSALLSSDVRGSLEKLLNEDPSESAEQFEELVLLKSVYDYYPKHRSLDSILMSVLMEISDSSPFPENSKIANNYIHNLTIGKKGSLFPDIEYINRIGDSTSLLSFQGQMIYLQIFASWSSSSLAELELMYELNKKYNMNVRFVSLSIDPDQKTFDSFLKANKKYKWEFGWIGVHPDVLEVLSIYDLPLFYLISDDFSIINWPSLWPSTGIEKVFYDEMLKEKEEKKFRFWENQNNKSKREE